MIHFMDNIKKNVQKINGNIKSTQATNPRVLSMLETYDVIKNLSGSNIKNKHAIHKLKASPTNSSTKLNNSMSKRSDKKSTNSQSFYSNFEESEVIHENITSRFNIPHLKSFELVSSISTKFDDKVSRVKVYEDFDIDQGNIVGLENKEVKLKVHEKNHKLNMENEEHRHMNIESHGGFSENNSPLRSINNNEIYESTLKSRPSSAPKRMDLSMSNKEEKNKDVFDFNTYKKEELNAIGTYRSRGVKGVKEDCERFRLQMKILKEKANDSRIREVMVEGMVENLHKIVHEETINETITENTNDVIENNAKRQNNISVLKNLVSSIDNLNIEGNHTKQSDDTNVKINQHCNEEILFASSIPNRRSKSSSPSTSNFEGKNNRQNDAYEDFKARKRIKTYNNFLSYSSSSNSSISSTTSSTTSSLSSLPLSHYIQKLKCLAPISRCPSNPSTNINKNIITDNNYFQTTSINAKSSIDIGCTDCQISMQDSPNYNPSSNSNLQKSMKSNKDERNMQVDIDMKNHVASKSLDSNINNITPSVDLPFQSNAHVGIFACQRTKKPFIASIKNNNMISHGEKTNKKVGKIMFKNCSLPYENKYLNEKSLESYNAKNEIILPQLDNLNKDNEFISYEDSSIQQIMFNELKKSIEGFNIRIEVETTNLKNCFDDLEKQVDYSREEMSKEIFEARCALQNDIKIKLEKTTNSFFKKNEINNDEVISTLEENFKKHQLQSDIGISALKNEMKQLWIEVKELSKSKKDIQSYIDSFMHTNQKSNFDVNNECNELKNENNILLKQLQSFKQSDLQMEIDNVRRLVEKSQEGNVEIERNQSAAYIEGIRERMLIMERVESLSQLYLGGLEEIRSNVSNIKISCRDRMDEIEGEWNEFRRHQECYAINCHPVVLTQHMLMDELKNIRIEVAEIVKAEREHIQKILESENVTIQHQFMTVCATNKHEILNSIKEKLNKHLQTAQSKILLMTNAMKQEMKNLKCEIGEGHESTENLLKATSLMKKEIEIAAQAANEATIIAIKAKEMFNEMHQSFEIEIANVQHVSLQLQKELMHEKDIVQSIANEACKSSKEFIRKQEQIQLVASATQAKNLDLNNFLQKETLNIVQVVASVQKERDIISQIVEEAKYSAIKAAEILAEGLNFFNGEMTKARQMSIQLLEGLEREKEGFEREREIALQYNEEAQDRFSKELELAITDWKCAMNVEIAKTKEVTYELEEEQRRALLTLDQTTMLCPQLDYNQVDMEEYISKTQHTLDDLIQSVHQLQNAREDKNQCLLIKQHELEQFKKNWQVELNKLQQMMRVLEKKYKELICEQSTAGTRIEMVENVQVNLVQSYEDVRNSTSDLEKTAAIWLPKYEAAARIVNELSSKVERIDKQIELTCNSESLVQQIAHVAESKINGMKDMVISSYLKDIGIEMKELVEQVNREDRTNTHAIALLESRINVLEKSFNHDSNVSLKLEYIENSGKESNNKCINKSSITYLSQSIEALQRKMEIMASEHNDIVALDSNQALNSKIVDLESRIEHVASATFTNLRLLDKKVGHVTIGVQSALDGATIADEKCASLGFELVKVFRMFSNKRDVQSFQNNCCLEKECKESKTFQSPTKGQQINEGLDIDSHSQSTIDGAIECVLNTSRTSENHHSLLGRTNISPRKIIKRGVSNSVSDISYSKVTHTSQIHKPTLHHEQDNEEFSNFEEGGSSSKIKINNLQDSSIGANECKIHGPLIAVDECKTIIDTNLDRHLRIEKRQEGLSKNCQRTNIRLDAGRIHVNVSHRSSGLNQISEKRNDIIAVQS